MHEAKRSRDTNDAEQKTNERQYSSGSHFELRRQALERNPSSIFRLWGGFERHPCLRGRIERHFSKVFFAPEQARSGHFEPSAAPGQAGAAVSSPRGHFKHLARAASASVGLEQPFRARLRSRAMLEGLVFRVCSTLYVPSLQ